MVMVDVTKCLQQTSALLHQQLEVKEASDGQHRAQAHVDAHIQTSAFTDPVFSSCPPARVVPQKTVLTISYLFDHFSL